MNAIAQTLSRRRYIASSLFLLLLACTLPAQTAERRGTSFDHSGTGFALRGAHAQAECQTCHLNGQFKGTPTQCAQCHVQGSRMASSFKPMNHPMTAQPCDLCHSSTSTWAGARFRHTGVVPGNCGSCHNGSIATGKPGGHIDTILSCDSCHRTTAWTPSWFNHTGVVPGTCLTCHNGTTATGLTSQHIPAAGLSCDLCHNAGRTFQTNTFRHYATQGVIPGQCATCHSGAYKSQGALGLPSLHIPSPNPAACDLCHTTSSFSSSTFKHTVAQGVVAGGCLTCHSGAYKSIGVRGKPSEHPSTGTNTSCDGVGCHNTSNWDR
jgi:hypothetical protein